MASFQKPHKGLEAPPHSFSLGAKQLIPVRLGQDAMLFVLDKVKAGDRNLARSALSRTLNINDVIAEYCLRHLEEKLREEPAYVDRVISQLGGLPNAAQKEQLQILSYAFGVHGTVSKAILMHLSHAGQKV